MSTKAIPLMTRFGEDTCMVEEGVRIDGARLVTIMFRETTSPCGEYVVADLSFHEDDERQGIAQLRQFRDLIDSGIRYLENQ